MKRQTVVTDGTTVKYILAQQVSMTDVADVMDRIGDRKYVSFDIYDTLVIRPYVIPTDLFRHVESLYNREGFAESRVSAERTARRKHTGEVTLDQIYDEIDPTYCDLMSVETDMEINVPVLNKKIIPIIDGLKKTGKKIILISDMYLPGGVLERLLERLGFDSYDRLYVSSESKKTKHTGELFDLVLRDLGIGQEDIFHIGDNRHSDHNVPKRMGIDSFLIERPIDGYFRRHREEQRFYNKRKELERSIIVSLDMIMEQTDDDWFDIGRRYGGPLATSFSMFINRKSEDDSLFLYASRDGYNPKRISEELYPNNKTEYIFTQRLLLDVLTDSRLPYGKVVLPSKLTERYAYEKTSVAMRRILNFFRKDLGEEIPSDVNEMNRFYNNNSDTLDRLRKNRLKEYIDYLKEKCQSSDLHLIDCTTMRFSSQRLLESATGEKVTGHYLVTLSDDDTLEYDSMCDWYLPVIGWMNIDIPEFFLCSPEYPLSGWNNGPIFDYTDENDRARVGIYDRVSDGELEYARYYKSIFGKYMIPFDYWSVVKWSKMSIVSGKKCRRMMDTIKWASDPDHSEYLPLVTGSSSIRQILKKIVIGAIDKINHE